MYLEGRGGNKNPILAKKLFKKAVKRNETNAMYSLGNLYRDGAIIQIITTEEEEEVEQKKYDKINNAEERIKEKKDRVLNRVNELDFESSAESTAKSTPEWNVELRAELS